MLPNSTLITIKEKSFVNSVFNITINFKTADAESEFDAQIKNPTEHDTDQLLEWYFEHYITQPFDDVKVDTAVQAIRDYGKYLFKQLFTQNPDLIYHYRTALQQGADNITIAVVGDSPVFQAIYWESLHDPSSADPLIAIGITIVRKYVKPVQIKATPQPAPTINLLIVTARPNEENDVSYRTIQRPLIDLIHNSKTPIRPHILRPGTYEALVRHLEHKTGYYHLIHFDVHGSLLNYATYKYYLSSIQNLSFQRHNIFNGQFALKELEEKDFNGGTRAFLFFESEEKGKAVAVEAFQLAGMLEHKQIPLCLLNACQSAKQDNSTHETSLGRALIQKGLQLVLAMRYSVSVSAASIMMGKLYEQLYAKKPIEQAIASSRKELYWNKNRKANYNQDIDLEDWLLPVVYQNGQASLNIRPFTLEEEECYIEEQQLPEEAKQQLRYGFFGRDLDILKIEKNLLLRSNMILLQGMGGAGKTTLLKYLIGWWLRTGFIHKVFYFGYDMKAYSLPEILHQVAQAIYSKHEYAAFTAKNETVQEHNIVAVLRSNQYALVLDNTESITGEKLAIPNTLAESERQVLKGFLSELKGGNTFIIIGSRSSEEWLKGGTFESNQYLLRGLDPESANSFALSILKEAGVTEGILRTIVNGTEFERLMMLLAGYPLALKAILPGLKKKTTKHILEELLQGIGELDKGNPQQKEESILKCIEYAYSNLSEEAQQLLLCLAPFQSIINLQPSVIDKYFDELRKERLFKDYPFDKLETVMQEAVQNGFMQRIESGSTMQLMSLQPVFTFFLKNRLSAENALMQHLQAAYVAYYEGLSKFFYQYLSSRDPQKQQISVFHIELEYENLHEALNISLKNNHSIMDVYKAMETYLDKNQLTHERLELAEKVHARLQEYPIERLEAGVGFELALVKHTLARTFHKLQRHKSARHTYQELLSFMDSHPSFFKNLAYSKAPVYQNLGNVAMEQKEYQAAREYLLEALNGYAQFNDLHGKGQIYACLGIVSLRLRKYTDARDYCLKALDVLIQLKDIYNQGGVFQTLAVVSVEQNDFVAAREYFLEALKVYVQFNDLHSQGEVYESLGNVSMEQKDYSAAREYLLKALDVSIQFKDIYSQGRVYANLGNVSTKQKDYVAARDYYFKSLQVFVQFNDIYSQGQVYTNLGNVSMEQKDYATAKEYYQNALDAFLKFPEDISSFETLLQHILSLIRETGNKVFGQAMIQKMLPHLSGENKNYLVNLLNEISRL